MIKMYRLTKGQLRWLAMLFMVLDHFAEMFLKPGLEGRSEILTKLQLSRPAAKILCEVFLSLGTFTGIVMIYFLIEGYFYTKDLKKYLLRLLLFGLISQIPFYMAFRFPDLNMLFTLAVCLCTIYVHYHVPDSGKKNLMILGLFLVNCFSDWTIMAVPITLFLVEAFEPVPKDQRSLQDQIINSGHRFKVNQNRLKIAWIKSFLLMLIVFAASTESLFNAAASTGGFIFAAVLLTFYYDDSKPEAPGSEVTDGAGSFFLVLKKYFFYIFYPLHLIILLVIYRSVV